MTPRAQELYDIATTRAKKEGKHKNSAGLQFRVAEILATALDLMERDISRVVSTGFIREGLVPGSIDEFHGRKPSDAGE